MSESVYIRHEHAYSELLQCEWISWSAPSPGLLVLRIPEDNCCAMDGAIQIGKLLMPSVRVIQTVYRRKGGVDGKWIAYNYESYDAR